MKNDFINNPKYPSYSVYQKSFGGLDNAIRMAGLWDKHYNETNSCDRCGKSFEELGWGHPLKEYDEKGEWTKKWDCPTCQSKYDPNSYGNTIRSVRNCRTHNQNPNFSQTKGDKSQELACGMYGWEDLNKKNDNYTRGTPIDCYDPKTGLFHQVRGRWYDSINRCWQFVHLERERFKEYEDMVCYCISKDGKRIERIYKIPLWKITERKSIGIYKYDIRRIPYEDGWYEQYRVTDEEELKKANEIYQKISKEESEFVTDNKQGDI